jgi:hypothetical protein
MLKSMQYSGKVMDCMVEDTAFDSQQKQDLASCAKGIAVRA